MSHIALGSRVGRLVVIDQDPVTVMSGTRKRKAMMCRCDCGTVKPVLIHGLMRGRVKSCGCYKRDQQQIITRRNARTTCYNHSHPLYGIWAGMHQRCTNPAIRQYYLYGGRGIRVCERWNSFEAFAEDVGDRPSKKHSLDRYPNKDGNYEPGNVRWATPKQQGNNTRFNHLITFQGRTQTLTEWSREIGISVFTLSQRIVQYKWSVERALTSPLNPPRPKKVKPVKPPRWPALDINAILEMRERGMSMREISRRVGTTHTRVGDAIARHRGSPTHYEMKKWRRLKNQP